MAYIVCNKANCSSYVSLPDVQWMLKSVLKGEGGEEKKAGTAYSETMIYGKYIRRVQN